MFFSSSTIRISIAVIVSCIEARPARPRPGLKLASCILHPASCILYPFFMFSTGAKVDIAKIEREIRQEIEEKRKRLFSDEELEELQNLELHIIPNSERVRPYFLKELD